MTHSLSIGLLLMLLAGLMAGNCMLPLKFQHHWKWENTWAIFSLVSLVVLPWALAFLLVTHLAQTYRALPLHALLTPALLGCGWGIAQVLFGLSVKRLGLGLAYAIIVGLGAVLGTLVPLFLQHRSQLNPSLLGIILTGVAVMVLGIVLSTWGGQIRERTQGSVPDAPLAGGYASAVLLAIVCGILAPMLNYAFAFGQNIAVQAAALGNTEPRAAYAVWPIGLAGGLFPNLAYSMWLLRKNRTSRLFRPLAPDGWWSVLMAVLWMGAMALYGMSAAYMGGLGTSVGWGLFQIFMIMTATLSGVWTGEWQRAPRSSRFLLAAGLVCLSCATGLLALSNASVQGRA